MRFWAIARYPDYITSRRLSSKRGEHQLHNLKKRSMRPCRTWSLRGHSFRNQGSKPVSLSYLLDKSILWPRRKSRRSTLLLPLPKGAEGSILSRSRKRHQDWSKQRSILRVEQRARVRKQILGASTRIIRWSILGFNNLGFQVRARSRKRRPEQRKRAPKWKSI